MPSERIYQGGTFLPPYGGRQFFNSPPYPPENGGRKIILPPGSRKMGGENTRKIGACGELFLKIQLNCIDFDVLVDRAPQAENFYVCTL